MVTSKNSTSGIKFSLVGNAAINTCRYPGLGRARSGCSDMLGLVQCIDVLYLRQVKATVRPAPG